MLVSDIIKQVREYLDEVSALNEAEVLNGSAPVDERIKAMIPECAVLLCNGKAMDVSTFTIHSGGVGTIEVPADYGRLKELKLSCWSRSVYNTVDAESAAYRRQQNIVTRGGTVRPVVAIVPHGEGRMLELYSVPTWDSRVKVERATYVAVPDATSEYEDIAVSREKEVELCYMVAVRVARSYGNESAAQLLSASLSEQMATTRII